MLQSEIELHKRCPWKNARVSASDDRAVRQPQHGCIDAPCTRCLHISDGRLQRAGAPHEVIAGYLSADGAPGTEATSLSTHAGRRPGSEVLMRSVTVTGDSGIPGAAVRIGARLDIIVTFESDRRALCPVLGLVVKNHYGVPLFGITTKSFLGTVSDAVEGRRGTCTLRKSGMPATYSIDLYLGDAYQDHDVIYDAVRFEVIAADVFGGGKLPGVECGSIVWPATWTYKPAAMPVAIDHT